MKKYVLTAIVATMMWTVTLCLLAQSPAGQGQGQPPSGQGRGQAPGVQGRGGPRGGGGQVNPETVNAAVAEIEKQLAVLKKAMEGAPTMPGGRSQGTQKPVMGGGRAGGMTPEMMAQNQQRFLAVREATAAIADQVLVLKGNQARVEQEDVVAELESIISSANQEKATGTAELTQSIIDTGQKAFTEKAAKLAIGLRGGMGGRGSSYTPPPGGFKYNDK